MNDKTIRETPSCETETATKNQALGKTTEPARQGKVDTDAATAVPHSSRGSRSQLDRERLGRFHLRSELGSGSFGRVYSAYDPQLDREVALKVSRNKFDDVDELERFFREARAAGQLKHPNIVPVFEVGHEGDTAYIVYALVAGESLDRVLVKQRFSPNEATRLLLKLADAVHSAHQRGIFHRDIKPANVLIDLKGEPHLMDFGVARRHEGESLQTQEGDILGTPAYMSPEQARGENKTVDARSDLYSLGVILYELLCGKRPFEGSVLQLLQRVQEQTPVSPRRWNARVPRDLETICLKTLAKRPQDRYASVQHFADDLKRWLEHRPILARRANVLERTAMWARRQPLLAGLAATGLAAVMMFTAYSLTRPAYLDLRVLPADAKVELDGKSVPLVDGRAVVSHGPGKRELKVTKAGYRIHEQEVRLVRGRTNAAVVNVELFPAFGYVQAESDPEGAAVELRDAKGKVVARGATPFHSARLPAGEYTLSLIRDRFVAERIHVTVPDGDRVANVPLARLKASAEGADSLAGLRKRLQFLEEETKGEFIETPLKDVLDFISDAHKVTIKINTVALESIGVSLDLPITRNVKKGTLRLLFEFMLDNLQVAVVPRLDKGDVYLEITSVEDAHNRMEVVMFPIGDLLSPEPRPSSVDDLLDVIETKVAVDTWENVGGAGSIDFLSPNLLVVSQSWDVHAKIDSYLVNLRQSGAMFSSVRKPREFPDGFPRGMGGAGGLGTPRQPTPSKLPGGGLF